MSKSFLDEAREYDRRESFSREAYIQQQIEKRPWLYGESDNDGLNQNEEQSEEQNCTDSE